MDDLKLHVAHRSPDPGREDPPTGFVHVERGPCRGVLLTPEEIRADRLYPLITVLHGAGRQDELLVKAYRDEPAGRNALFFVPRSRRPTWDLIAGGDRSDLDFLDYAYDLIWRRYPIDPERQGLVGYSDGASYALAVGLANPGIFRAVMGWAAGFLVLDPAVPAGGPRPAVLLEYGTHDPIFPFDRVAVPMRRTLEHLGYTVEFRVDEGGRHWPSGDFQSEALDWFFSQGWERSG